MKTDILSETLHKDGYLIRVERMVTAGFEVVQISGDESEELDDLVDALTSSQNRPIEMTSAYTPDGSYIGSVERAERLYGLGIIPELRAGSIKEEMHPCSIGFCKSEQKWYGWSHRAMYGFGVGSVTKEGDCSYQAPNKEAFGRNMMHFFCDKKDMTDMAFKDSVDTEGGQGVLITAKYTDDVPNEKLHGTEYSTFWPYPEKFGRGEWAAETLDDAKQMAEDFAEGVS